MAVPRARTLFIVLGLVLVVPLGLVVASAVAVWNAAHTDDAAKVQAADAIIVLGAAQYQGDPSPVFEGRLEGARILYEQGRADTILVIGGGLPGDETTEAQAGAAHLVDMGVPEDAVVPIPEGHTTMESLSATAEYMRAHDMGSAFLVSDPWHNLRIKRMASDLGIEPYVSATWHSAAVSQQTRFAGYFRETFAYLYYRLFGR